MTSPTNAAPTRTPLPCGSWPSPVTIEAMLASGTGLAALGVDGQDVLWTESRPQEDGRCVLVRRTATGVEDLTPAPASVRSRVQEYGGGTWHAQDGVVAWCNDTDAAVHVLEDGADRAITPCDRAVRYGGLRVDARRRLVLAVREDHRGEGEALTTLVALRLDGLNEDGGTVLAGGADFYAHPELSDDGRLAWVQWRHPDMPWDATWLCVASLLGDWDEGLRLGEAQHVAGGAEVSAVHPLWGEDGTLYHLSDDSGFWNPWAWDGEQRRQLLDSPHDFCRPLWVLGNAEYAVLPGGRLLVRWYEDAAARIGVLEAATGRLDVLDVPLADVDCVAAGPAGAFLEVSHADRADEVVELDVDLVGSGAAALATVRAASEELPPAGSVSIGEALWFEGRHGRSHAWYYPPTSAEHEVPQDELPPLVVNTHGGPTGMASAGYNPSFQFWTSRGFAVLDVNYSGSAGFGREYRNRLFGTWGIADVDDAVDAVRAVVERGLADPRRVAIQGGSAGGYTTLQALVSSDVFAAGVSRYGIGDLETLVTDTHKFESRYPIKLVGPYPEARPVYLERSPIHHVERLSSPMLILQGLDDKVVPPNQAEAMARAVRDKQLPVALIMFEGEGHGFRKQATRRAVVEAQLSFFSQLFGFTPADDVPVLEVENL